MSKVPLAISQYDINHCLQTEGLDISDLFDAQIKEVLEFLGMDTAEIEIEEVLHRPQYSPNNQPWFGKRFLGFERQDKSWMFSKKSSIENIIASQTDGGHAAELMRMSSQGGQTAIMADHLEKLAAQAEVIEETQNEQEVI